MNPKIFPSILIILMTASAAVYLFQGNWRMAVYWTAAATMTGTITF